MTPPAQPPRIGIDARCLNTEHLRGMGKYVAEMLAHAGGCDFRWSLFGDRPNTAFHVPAGITADVDLFEVRGYRFHSWEQLGLPSRARRRGARVLHCTATTLPYWQPVPTIVTVHDTLPWKSEDAGAAPGWYWNTLVPAALRKCRSVITISEASRRDILELWPCLDSKLHVIPHGVADSYLSIAPEPLSPSLAAQVGTDSYLLYIGGSLERKRFDWAVRLLQALADPRLNLIACGFAAGETEAARAALPAEISARVRFLGFVGETEMPRLYQNAIAVLYPTLYEGFGFPALEAQAVGTPVLFSALGSLAELQGPASEVLPAWDLQAWLQTLQRLLEQRSAQADSYQPARSWARKFAWSVSAAKHCELYRRALVRSN